MYTMRTIECPRPEIAIREGLFDELRQADELIHLVLIATKPDIIKQAPLILELRRRGKRVLVVHSGQHHDWNLSRGLEIEFGIEPDINLNIRGCLYEQQSQIIHRFGYILSQIREMGKRVIPYTYGDTTTAVAGGIASFMNLLGVAHVEAGLRTLTPPRAVFSEILCDFDVMHYYHRLRQSGEWVKGSYEPFPEQFDTRAAAPSARLHFAPTHLNAKHLLDEGFAGERIFVVGNPVSDALELAKVAQNREAILDKYPLLRKEGVVRFCVHRRENVSSLHRFKAIFDAMVHFILEGRPVLFISLGATEMALDAYNLRGQVEDLSRRYDNFIYSPVWLNYAHVVAAMQRCCVIATDSGSIQEETNMLGIPGVVLRFNSDRPEAIFAGANILAPPIDSKIIVRIITEVIHNKELNSEMRHAGKLYGHRVSQKMVNVVEEVASQGSLFELFEQERLGLTKLDFWKDGGNNW